MGDAAPDVVTPVTSESLCERRLNACLLRHAAQIGHAWFTLLSDCRRDPGKLRSTLADPLRSRLDEHGTVLRDRRFPHCDGTLISRSCRFSQCCIATSERSTIKLKCPQ